MSLLIENFPEAAEVVLNQCVHTSEHLSISDPEYTVTSNFKYIDPDPDVKMPNGRFSAIQTMIQHKRERLLLHPLTLKFNERKWDRLGRYVYMFDFGTYLILMILLTVHTVKVREGEVKPEVLFMLLAFTLLHICKEFLQIYVQRWNYFKDTTNYLDWILYITAALSALFVLPYYIPREVFVYYISTEVFAIGTVMAIFVCYANMMLFLRRYRLFGTYISMYVEVTKTVFQVMVVFVFLLFGFALVFYLLFKEKVRTKGRI